MVVMQKAKSMLSLHHGRKMGSYRSALFRREEEEGGDTRREGKGERGREGQRDERRGREFKWKKQIKNLG